MTLPTTDALSPSMEGSWIGDVRGTVFGNAYAESVLKDGGLSFDIRIANAGKVAVLEGVLRDRARPTIELTQTLPVPPEGEQPLTGHIQVDQFLPERITGRWALSNGAAGVIWLSKTTTREIATTVQTTGRAQPVELSAKETTLPNATLYKADLQAIIDRLGRLIGAPAEVVITAEIDGRNVIQFAGDFFARSDLPRTLGHIKLNISDNAQPFAKSILIVLSGKEDCKIVVQSDNATWTTGVHADVSNLMERYMSRVRVLFQRHGLNLNFIFFLAAIITVPDLPLSGRIPFILIIIVILVAFANLHRRLTRTTIYLDSTERGKWAKEVPSMVMSLIAAAVIYFISQMYLLFTSDTFWPALKQLLGFTP